MALTKLLALATIFSVPTLFVYPVTATGPLYGLPVLNGPINTVPNIPGAKSRVGDFVHPGLWHTHDDLERIRTGVNQGLDPWKSVWANFSTDSYSQSDVRSKKPRFSLNAAQDICSRLPCSTRYRGRTPCFAGALAATTRVSATTCEQRTRTRSCGTSPGTGATGTGRQPYSTHGVPT